MWSFVQTVRCSKPHPEGEYSEDPLDGNTVLVFPNICAYVCSDFHIIRKFCAGCYSRSASTPFIGGMHCTGAFQRCEATAPFA